MDWMLMPLRRYADFAGRSRRKEYWMFVLFQLIIFSVSAIVSLFLFGLSDPASGAMTGGLIILLALLALVFLIPGIAVTVRRFHDQDKSGWFYLLNFIPYLGGFIVLVFMCFEGTRGPNRFGPDPKGTDPGDVFA